MLLKYIAAEKDRNVPLGIVLRTSMSVSDSLVRKTKREHRRLEVDGKPSYTNLLVSPGQTILVDLPDYPPVVPCEFPFAANKADILYSDEYLLAAWKPPYVQTHPSPSAPNGSDTLEDRVQRQTAFPAHPVHRLDQETSGIILFAKFPYIQSVLQCEMQDNRFQKEYHAFVYGVPPCDSGSVKAPILQVSPDDFTRVLHPDGQAAESLYELISTFRIENQIISLVKLSPLTGRTHQLRIHMASIGCPILGDCRYGTQESILFSQRIGLKRQQLCSDRVCFEHPISKEKMIISASDDLELSVRTKQQVCT